jgi:hypothetical protein
MSTRSSHHYLRELQSREISRIVRYFDTVIQYQPLPHDDGTLCKLLNTRKPVQQTDDLSTDTIGSADRIAVLLNGNLNHCHNIQQLFSDIKPHLNRRCRLIIVAYNPYMNWIFNLLAMLGIRNAPQPTTFVKHVELDAINKLSGFEAVRIRQVGYCPRLLGLGRFFNKIMPMVPLLRWLCISNVITLRPIIPETRLPSLSILIPARNESGNIENALNRIPEMPGVEKEVIFVEGNSTDGTWEKIQNVLSEYAGPCRLLAYQQEGKGKSDAVRAGFKRASGDVLTILDADLTMPPELLNGGSAWESNPPETVLAPIGRPTPDLKSGSPTSELRTSVLSRSKPASMT